MSDTPTRYARVRGSTTTVEAVERYLPANYEVVGHGTDDEGPYVLIEGHDAHGWTLDGYVLPRLASGLHFGVELTEDQIEDERTQARVDAGADVVDALVKLYELTDGDEAAVGEQLYEIDKAARLRYTEQEDERT